MIASMFGMQSSRFHHPVENRRALQREIPLHPLPEVR